jgi:hypothetical protein
MGALPLSLYVARQVVSLGREMREAQTSYFSSKSGGMLQLSKRLEARFDRLLRSIDLEASGSLAPPVGFSASSPEELQEYYIAFPEYGSGTVPVSTRGQVFSSRGTSGIDAPGVALPDGALGVP